MNNKTTKLGIPDPILVALVFAAGLTNTTVMIGLALYILVCENSEVIRDAAKKAMIIFAVFAVLFALIYVFDDTIGLLLNRFSFYNTSYRVLTDLLSALNKVVYVVMAVIGMIKASSAQAAAPSMRTAAAIPQAAPQAAAMVCPSCGNPLENGARFCKKCGAKMN